MCTLRSLLTFPFGGNCAVYLPMPRSPIINWQFKLRGEQKSCLFQQPQEAGSDYNRASVNDSDQDAQLVRQLQNGNQDALTALFEKYSGAVFRLARRVLQNSGEAEEVVQRVFIDTYKAIHQFDPQKASYKTWLYQFAYHRSLNRKRDLEAKAFYASVELDEQQLMAELYEGAGRFIQQLSSEETVQLVRQLLKSSLIKRKERLAIRLTFFYGFTAEEIAARTGESPAAVRHNLYRGLAKLRTALLDSAQQRAGSRSKTERMLVADPARLL